MRDSQVQRVLISQGAFGELMEPSWNRALTELGVQSEIFCAHNLTLPGIAGRIERRVMGGPGVHRANRMLIETVTRMRPDVTLLYQGHYFDQETVHELRSLTFVAGYHDDDPFGPKRMVFRYRRLIPALKMYHGFHVIRKVNLSEYERCGVPNVGLLRHAYRPWLHYPTALTLGESRQWQSDVTFIGHPEKDIRIPCLFTAVQADLKVRVFGGEHEWDRFIPRELARTIGATPRVFGADYRKALAGAKIAAAFYSKWNRDDHGMRSFEIPACGAFLLSERTETMTELYEEGKEADFFSSPEEFVDKVRFYVRHEDVRKKVAALGHRKVTSAGHDIHSRMRQWLGDVSRWRRDLWGGKTLI